MGGKDLQKRLSKAAAMISSADSLLVTAHQRPDGDAVGSLLGLASALKAQGRRVLCYTNDPIKANFRFLPGSDQICHELPDDLSSIDTLVILDCHDPERIGPEGRRLVEAIGRICVLDHHLGQGLCGSVRSECVQVIETSACATGAICLGLLELLGWPVTRDVATCLYTAIMTDTGGFAYSNTSSFTFEVARKLVEKGADPYRISANVFETRALSQLKMLGEALSGLETYFGGRFSLMQVGPEMFKKWGCTESDTDEFVAYARSIDGVEIAALVKEFIPGRVSVSLRSKFFANVAALAAEFGGGGHFHAAGFKTKGSRQDVIEQLLKRVEAYLDGAQAGAGGSVQSGHIRAAGQAIC